MIIRSRALGGASIVVLLALAAGCSSDPESGADADVPDQSTTEIDLDDLLDDADDAGAGGDEADDVLAEFEWDGDPCELITAEQLNAPIEPTSNGYVYQLGDPEAGTTPFGNPVCTYTDLNPEAPEGPLRKYFTIEVSSADSWERRKQLDADNGGLKAEYDGIGRGAFWSESCNCIKILADGFEVELSGAIFWDRYIETWAENVHVNLDRLGYL